jgi:chromosomal replication initiator protein
LIVKINEPDKETCIAILRKKVSESGLDINKIDDAVLDFLAENFSRNVRELEGAINRLIFYVANMKQVNEITLNVAIEAIGSIRGGNSAATQLSEQKIINVVADYYNIPAAELVGKVRTGQIALARHIAMYLIRKHLDVPLKKIGEMFGGKDHTTVMSGISKVEKELKNNEQLKQAIEDLEKLIKE